jgi:hypothetical protein
VHGNVEAGGRPSQWLVLEEEEEERWIFDLPKEHRIPPFSESRFWLFLLSLFACQGRLVSSLTYYILTRRGPHLVVMKKMEEGIYTMEGLMV